MFVGLRVTGASVIGALDVKIGSTGDGVTGFSVGFAVMTRLVGALVTGDGDSGAGVTGDRVATANAGGVGSGRPGHDTLL